MNMLTCILQLHIAVRTPYRDLYITIWSSLEELRLFTNTAA